jgi:nitroimidazol reductase NimA-like FMN-containing flavoprotein (pyridoxamine 5'-phosphate oxidase superfamily)
VIVTLTSLDPGAVREGHRALLDTFEEFTAALDAGDGVLPHPAMLTGAVAFLRESLLPFARSEESVLDYCPATREDTAFEHAFLEMETDRLSATVHRLLAGSMDGAPSRAAHLAEMRRSLHRIGAVLELHVRKAEDREHTLEDVSASDGQTFEPALDVAPAGAEPGRRRGDAARNMLPSEASDFLRRQQWGVLSTVGPDGPHAVPVSYAWDGRQIFFASAPGTKTRHMEQLPAVSLSVLRVTDGSRWSSVLVRGDAARVEDVRGRFRAIGALARQRSVGVPLNATDLARLRGAILYRVEPIAITGRARGE